MTVNPNGQVFRLAKDRKAGYLLDGEPLGVDHIEDAIREATTRIRDTYVPEQKKQVRAVKTRRNSPV